MNEGLIPGRYAKALLESAAEVNAEQGIYDVMRQLSQSFAGEPSLVKVLENPFVDSADKIKLVETAAGISPDDKATYPLFSRFLGLLVSNNRISMTRNIALAYMELYRKAHNICKVSVTSASPMTPADEDRLKSLIERHLNGAQMEYTSDVDPDLIGGFVVKINNEILDASVANELKHLRLNLLSK
ncbi:MAG: F0F1 ATP synthase subunit delta [Duncaniella sp.]|nr:F0F1 ATP synthase subunit delta [Duncaniella sp.]